MHAIIGCGNPNRSDDGVGPWVIWQLQAQLGDAVPDDTRLFDAGTAGMEVMFQARGCDRLTLVDACSSGAAPGSLYCVPGEELAGPLPAGANLHAFRWQQALYAGHRIFGADFPAQVAVYLIEAAELGLGLELSAPVQSAALRLVQRLRSEMTLPATENVA